LASKLFDDQAGLAIVIAQIAKARQIITKMVAAGFGAAIVWRWTSRLGVSGVQQLRRRGR
jgi:hypothetical protein